MRARWILVPALCVAGLVLPAGAGAAAFGTATMPGTRLAVVHHAGAVRRGGTVLTLTGATARRARRGNVGAACRGRGDRWSAFVAGRPSRSGVRLRMRVPRASSYCFVVLTVGVDVRRQFIPFTAAGRSRLRDVAALDQLARGSRVGWSTREPAAQIAADFQARYGIPATAMAVTDGRAAAGAVAFWADGTGAVVGTGTLPDGRELRVSIIAIGNLLSNVPDLLNELLVLDQNVI